ncbi:MAG: Sporulation protein YunB [Eubacteriales bacterium SKADARSKE-1]|nr:Sporulation protein YunB [Eubacteriales bacterium SKADARSKE-1]
MRYRHRKLHKISLRKKFLIFSILFLISAIMLDHQMRPLITAVAKNRAQITSATTINDAVLEEINKFDINYSDIITLERNENGKIMAINTNIKKANILKASITLVVQERLSCMKKKNLNIPFGTLTGTEIFNGRGPNVPLKLTLSGSVLTDFRSNFESSGINQTKHQLYLDISTNVFAMIPGYPVTTAINTSVLIAETIIVGDVPTFFMGKS